MRKIPFAECFAKFTQQKGECLIWTGASNGRYGFARFNGKIHDSLFSTGIDMKSTQQMAEQCTGLIGTRDVSKWETEFLISVDQQIKDGRMLSDKQIDILGRIWAEHYA